MLVFGLFPHENITRRKLLTLVRREAASDEWEYTQTDRLEDDVRVPRVAEIL